MNPTLRTHHRTLAKLNITPLLDLVFVLLVIFIITTPQLMNRLEVNMPSNQTAATQNKPMPARILVLGRNRVLLDSHESSLAELRAELARRKAILPTVAAVVQGADDADYQAVVDVLEMLQQLEIFQVGLTTAENTAVNHAWPSP